MGGGQLGRMFVHAAQQMGYFTAVLDPDADSPAGRVSHHHIQTGYEDAAGLAELARVSAAVTTEFENVPAPALQTLAATRCVAPGADAVAIAQDRAREKAHFTRCGVACAPYAVIASEADLAAVRADLLPGILKTTRLGYDGKGQVRVKTAAELATRVAGPQGRALRAGEDAAAGGGDLGDRGARPGRHLRALSAAAQPAPRRHPGRDRGF